MNDCGGNELKEDLKTNHVAINCHVQDTVSGALCHLILTKICKVGIIIQTCQMRKMKLIDEKYLSLGSIINKWQQQHLNQNLYGSKVYALFILSPLIPWSAMSRLSTERPVSRLTLYHKTFLERVFWPPEIDHHIYLPVRINTINCQSIWKNCPEKKAESPLHPHMPSGLLPHNFITSLPTDSI